MESILMTLLSATIDTTKPQNVQLYLHIDKEFYGEAPFSLGDIITYDKYNGKEFYIWEVNKIDGSSDNYEMSCTVIGYTIFNLDLGYLRPGIKFFTVSSAVGEYSIR